MYCPVCFQNTLKLRSNGVVKLSFNGKSRSTSLFTYNLNKDSQKDLEAKLRERVVDFVSWYGEFQNKVPIKTFEAFSSDCQCSNSCKIDLVTTRVSVIGVLYSLKDIEKIISEEAQRFGVEVALVAQ